MSDEDSSPPDDVEPVDDSPETEVGGDNSADDEESGGNDGEAGDSDTEDGEEPVESGDGDGFIELTYFEMSERDTRVINGGDDRCEQLDEQTRRCEVDLSFNSTSNLLGAAFDDSTVESLSYEVCSPTDAPGSASILRGTIRSQWGDEMAFKAGKEDCTPGPAYWIVTGGTGRFEGASGAMSNTTTDHPSYSSFGTGQLRVRADLWEDWLPPVPETTPDSDADYLDVPYFEGIVSTQTTTQADDECDRSDPDMVVCATEASGTLNATLMGNAAAMESSGTSTELVSEACDLADGTTGVPQVVDSDGTITSAFGDELFFTQRTRFDPCATAGSGTSAAVGHWRATGGTGRFEDAHGLMSTVTTLELGFVSIAAGTLSVRADQWPGLAEEYANLPGGDDYIELRYWERFLQAGEGIASFERQPAQECDTTQPGLEVCEYTLRGNLTGTHIGAASEVQAGTITTRLDETCPNTGGVSSLREAAGVITTPWGDDLDFRNVAESCGSQYWVLDDGTGRFDGAGGVMTGLGAFEMGDDTVLLQIGDFRLRADLWADLIPQPD